MKVLIQRVKQASVSVDNQTVGEIGTGLTAFVGFCRTDTAAMLKPMAQKISTLRVFPGEKGEFDRSVLDIKGGVLLISQFTLYGDVRKGRRPDWYEAMPQEQANELYQQFVAEMRTLPITIAEGVFRAEMQVRLQNDGPVTLMIEL